MSLATTQLPAAFSFMEKIDVKKRKYWHLQQGVVYVWWGCGKADGQITGAGST